MKGKSGRAHDDHARGEHFHREAAAGALAPQRVVVTPELIVRKSWAHTWPGTHYRTIVALKPRDIKKEKG
jgi:hypothetical protein